MVDEEIHFLWSEPRGNAFLAVLVENWVLQSCEFQARLSEQQAGIARVVAVNEFQFHRQPSQCALLGKTGNKLVGIPQSGFVFVRRSGRGECKRQGIIAVCLKFLIEELQEPSEDRCTGCDLSTSLLKRKPVSRCFVAQHQVCQRTARCFHWKQLVVL